MKEKATANFTLVILYILNLFIAYSVFTFSIRTLWVLGGILYLIVAIGLPLIYWNFLSNKIAKFINKINDKKLEL